MTGEGSGAVGGQQCTRDGLPRGSAAAAGGGGGSGVRGRVGGGDGGGAATGRAILASCTPREPPSAPPLPSEAWAPSGAPPPSGSSDHSSDRLQPGAPAVSRGAGAVVASALVGTPGGGQGRPASIEQPASAATASHHPYAHRAPPHDERGPAALEAARAAPWSAPPSWSDSPLFPRETFPAGAAAGSHTTTTPCLSAEPGLLAEAREALAEQPLRVRSSQQLFGEEFS